MRRSTFFFGFLGVCLLTSALMLDDARRRRTAAGAPLARKADLVKKLGLTDYSLFTEARYTRNPAVADRHTPFQDYPLSAEHYPSGGLLLPPPHLKRP